MFLRLRVLAAAFLLQLAALVECPSAFESGTKSVAMSRDTAGTSARANGGEQSWLRSLGDSSQVVYPAQKPWIQTTDLFVQGEAGVHSYRIPALIQTGRGTLLAVADARRDSSRDLPGRIALVIRRSVDEGRTWTAARTLVQPAEGGVGDASLLLERGRNRVWCFFAYGPPGIGFKSSRAGTPTGPSTLQVHAIHSDDDGQNWSASEDLTPQIKDPAWQGLFVTSGMHIQTSKGRFLLPLVVRDGAGIVSARDAYSDDAGKTWRVGESLGSGTDESKVVELKDGAILQNFRDGETRLAGHSRDGGVTVYDLRHEPALIDPVCNAGFTLDTHSGQNIVIFTNPASRVREKLTVRLSFDNGQTWPDSRILFAGPSAYSSVVSLRDGTIAVLYERGDVSSTEKITFARFNLAWVSGTANRQ